jgi:hypothetical protein
MRRRQGGEAGYAWAILNSTRRVPLSGRSREWHSGDRNKGEDGGKQDARSEWHQMAPSDE